MKPDHLEYLQLIAHHQGYLMGYIRSLAPGISSEDVLQETNVTLWEKMEQFTPGSNFRAYASKIAYLKTMEALRDKKRSDWIIFDSDIIEEINHYYNANTDTNQAEKYQNSLRSCLQRLPPKDRHLIHLRYTLGKSIRSIAKGAEKTEGSLQQAFFRMRSALKDCINKHFKNQRDLP